MLEILTDLTTCSICEDTFDNGLRVPKFLSCFHSYCSACLGKIHENSGHFDCPICRTRTPGLSTNDLKTNFYVTKVLDALEADDSCEGATASASNSRHSIETPRTKKWGTKPTLVASDSGRPTSKKPKPSGDSSSSASSSIRPQRPPTPDHVGDSYLRRFCSPAKRTRQEGGLKCHICLEMLTASCTACSDSDPCYLVSLNNCFHSFHEHCLLRSFGTNRPEYFECPLCETLQGIKTGNQPADGQMTWFSQPQPLPGYSDCGHIEITYHFFPGIQDSAGPHPGMPFSAPNFPKRAYLPDNAEGNKIVRLLKEAFDRRLLFQIDSRNGMDFVTFGPVTQKIHKHPSNDSYGYPDPNYLNLVRMELNTLGIVE